MYEKAKQTRTRGDQSINRTKGAEGEQRSEQKAVRERVRHLRRPIFVCVMGEEREEVEHARLSLVQENAGDAEAARKSNERASSRRTRGTGKGERQRPAKRRGEEEKSRRRGRASEGRRRRRAQNERSEGTARGVAERDCLARPAIRAGAFQGSPR